MNNKKKRIKSWSRNKKKRTRKIEQRKICEQKRTNEKRTHNLTLNYSNYCWPWTGWVVHQKYTHAHTHAHVLWKLMERTQENDVRALSLSLSLPLFLPIVSSNMSVCVWRFDFRRMVYNTTLLMYRISKMDLNFSNGRASIKLQFEPEAHAQVVFFFVSLQFQLKRVCGVYMLYVWKSLSVIIIWSWLLNAHTIAGNSHLMMMIYQSCVLQQHTEFKFCWKRERCTMKKRPQKTNNLSLVEF